MSNRKLSEGDRYKKQSDPLKKQINKKNMDNYLDKDDYDDQ